LPLSGCGRINFFPKIEHADGIVRAGEGVATGRVGHQTPLGVVNALLSGVHAPGENHYELLRAFADDDVLQRMTLALEARGYRTHEFGDSVLIQSSRHGSYPIRIDPPGNPAQSSIEMPA
jgi:hypothetical protein